MAPEQNVVRLLCPSCGNILKLPLTAGGRKGKCPKCQTAMNVAKDLGALWLESEAVSLLSKSQKPSRVTEKPLSTLTPASKTTPVFTGGIDGIGGHTAPLLDPTVLKFGIVAVLVAFVVIVALVLSHFSSKNSDVQTVALAQAQSDAKKTVLPAILRSSSSAPQRIFSGFKSLWTMFNECKYSTPSTIY
jgi:hypothetical protein